MLNLCISIFMDSDEVSLLLSQSLDDDITGWLCNPQTELLLETACKKSAGLATLAEHLAQTKEILAQNELTVELRLSEGDPKFKQATCIEVQNCLISAYGIKPAASDIGTAYFAVLIRDSNSKVIATLLADFRPFPDNEIVTRMEAVDRMWQQKKIGRELFRFVESTVRFLMVADGFVCLNTAGIMGLCLKSYVDGDAPDWQKEMMLKFGFEEEKEDGWSGETEFFKLVHL